MAGRPGYRTQIISHYNTIGIHVGQNYQDMERIIKTVKEFQDRERIIRTGKE